MVEELSVYLNLHSGPGIARSQILLEMILDRTRVSTRAPLRKVTEQSQLNFSRTAGITFKGSRFRNRDLSKAVCLKTATLWVEFWDCSGL